MTLQQLHLRGGGPKSDKVHPAAVRSFVEGQTDLRAALGASEPAMQALRRQAEAFHATGRYGPCVDILLGLATLDDIRPDDAAMMAECFWALGDEPTARVCAQLYEDVLDAVEDALVEMEAAR